MGTNDVWGRSTRGIEPIFRRLLGVLPPRTVVATLPQGLPRRRTEPVNDLIRAEAAHRGLLVADVWSYAGPPWRGKFASDWFHPNERGYGDWGDAFLPALVEAAAAGIR